MRTLILLLSVLAVGFADSSPETNFEDEYLGIPSTYIFEDTVYALLKNLSETLAKNDPLTLPNVTFNINNGNISLDFKATDLQIKNYSQFEATNLKISVLPPKITFNIRFNGVEIYTPNYDVDALFIFIPFYGQGTGDIKITGFNIGGSASVTIGLSGITGIKNLKISLNVTDTVFDISGLLNNEPFSDIVSVAATDFVADFVNNHHERLETLLNPIVENLINGILNPPKSFDGQDVPVEPIDYENTVELDEETVLKYHVRG